MRFLMLHLFTLLLTSNKTYAGSPAPLNDTTKNTCLQAATRQLDEALLLMQKHYYKKNAVNWDSIITAAKNRISVSGSCADAYETINWCFKQMSETHSFLMPAAAAAVYTNDTGVLKTSPPLSTLVGEISGEWLGDKSIGYLTLPWINTTDEVICTRLADSIQSVIARLDEQGVQKWIIDLRKNTGGNCWPMIAGIGPLLGEGVCGYFVSAKEKLPISYRNGAAMQGKQARCTASKTYQTRHEKKWIIVLTGPRTSSSGEIVAMAFKGKEHTYFYGQPTAGLTTANASYPLSDKALLVLTVCLEADRTGKIYEGRIFPDEFISPETRYSFEDPAKSAAMMWLQLQ